MAATHPPRAMIEGLEVRRLMTVGPVVAQQFLGTVNQVTAVVLTFDQPLDPTTAQNPAAYAMVRKFRDSNDDPFEGGEAESESSRIRIESVTYDPNANTVTIIPRNAFELRRNFTVLVVRGRGQNAVLTPGGEAIDGDANGRPGGDVTLRYKSAAKGKFTFKESDGDRVTLRIDGPGRMFWFNPIRGKSSPSIFLRDTNATSSILTATIKQGRNGDGAVDIAQLVGTSTVQTTITSDPVFRIRSVVPEPA